MSGWKFSLSRPIDFVDWTKEERESVTCLSSSFSFYIRLCAH